MQALSPRLSCGWLREGAGEGQGAGTGSGIGISARAGVERAYSAMRRFRAGPAHETAHEEGVDDRRRLPHHAVVWAHPKLGVCGGSRYGRSIAYTLARV